MILSCVIFFTDSLDFAIIPSFLKKLEVKMICLFTQKGRLNRKIAMDYYNMVIRQSRMEEFYEDYKAPDTMEGRFEIVTLHAGLLVNRLCRPDMGVDGKKLAQALFDVMFRSIDLSIREAGVGDLAVPRRIKKMMTNFKGRTFAYDEAVRSGNGDLVHALSRNIYAEVPLPNQDTMNKLAKYTQDYFDALGNMQPSDFWNSKMIMFPKIEKTLEQIGQNNASQAA